LKNIFFPEKEAQQTKKAFDYYRYSRQNHLTG